MGLAASQAQLLSLTARMSDNELRAQLISNSKMRLATESGQVNERYVQALNDSQLMFTNYDKENSQNYQKLTFNALTSYSQYNNQYGLSTLAGKLLVSELEAKNFTDARVYKEKSLEAFLGFHDLEYDTTYFENLKQHVNEAGHVEYRTTDHLGNVVMKSSGYTPEELKIMYEGEEGPLKVTETNGNTTYYGIGGTKLVDILGGKTAAQQFEEIEPYHQGYDTALPAMKQYEYLVSEVDRTTKALNTALAPAYKKFINDLETVDTFGNVASGTKFSSLYAIINDGTSDLDYSDSVNYRHCLYALNNLIGNAANENFDILLQGTSGILKNGQASNFENKTYTATPDIGDKNDVYANYLNSLNEAVRPNIISPQRTDSAGNIYFGFNPFPGLECPIPPIEIKAKPVPNSDPDAPKEYEIIEVNNVYISDTAGYNDLDEDKKEPSNLEQLISSGIVTSASMRPSKVMPDNVLQTYQSVLNEILQLGDYNGTQASDFIDSTSEGPFVSDETIYDQNDMWGIPRWRDLDNGKYCPPIRSPFGGTLNPETDPNTGTEIRYYQKTLETFVKTKGSDALWNKYVAARDTYNANLSTDTISLNYYDSSGLKITRGSQWSRGDIDKVWPFANQGAMCIIKSAGNSLVFDLDVMYCLGTSGFRKFFSGNSNTVNNYSNDQEISEAGYNSYVTGALKDLNGVVTAKQYTFDFVVEDGFLRIDDEKNGTTPIDNMSYYQDFKDQIKAFYKDAMEQFDPIAFSDTVDLTTLLTADELAKVNIARADYDAAGIALANFLYGNTTSTRYRDMCNVDWVRAQFEGSDETLYPETQNALDVIDYYYLDRIMNTYGEPQYEYIDVVNPDENNAKKTQWYTNLFNRMLEGYQVLGEAYPAALEDGLASSPEWIKYALESGLVKMEQADQNGEWSSFTYSNCMNITEKTDQLAVTQAEAEYKRDMDKIQSKDKRYDMELKNIDTEHNSLQTEYDSLKAAIDKNVERTFKIYSA
ncbi:MAG: hypothetical protein LBK53_02225 [Heliobacteriaceae bacterium]|jgi:hypothetical protein|nr:hypothetical protein [Heliobacteriaceae bacterium]